MTSRSRSKRQPKRRAVVTRPIVGAVSQGAPVTQHRKGSREAVTLPSDLIAAGETVFRVGAPHIPELGIELDDLLVIEPRPDGAAATGELVLAAVRDRVFVGRWWAKHGKRELVDGDLTTVACGPDLRVAGVVTLIVRVARRLPLRDDVGRRSSTERKATNDAQ